MRRSNKPDRPEKRIIVTRRHGLDTSSPYLRSGRLEDMEGEDVHGEDTRLILRDSDGTDTQARWNNENPVDLPTGGITNIPRPDVLGDLTGDPGVSTHLVINNINAYSGFPDIIFEWTNTGSGAVTTSTTFTHLFLPYPNTANMEVVAKSGVDASAPFAFTLESIDDTVPPLATPIVTSVTGNEGASSSVFVNNLSDYNGVTGITFHWNIQGSAVSHIGSSYPHLFGTYPSVISMEVRAVAPGNSSELGQFTITTNDPAAGLPVPIIDPSHTGLIGSQHTVQLNNLAAYSSYPGVVFDWNIQGSAVSHTGNSYTHTYGGLDGDTVTIEVAARLSTTTTAKDSTVLTSTDNQPPDLSGLTLTGLNCPLDLGSTGTFVPSGGTDPDGDGFTYSVSSVNNRVAFSPSSGIDDGDTVSYTVSSSLSDIGQDAAVTVTATDSYGNTVDKVFNCDIRDNQDPVTTGVTISIDCPLEQDETGTFTVQGGIDPEGGSVTYDVTVNTTEVTLSNNIGVSEGGTINYSVDPAATEGSTFNLTVTVHDASGGSSNRVFNCGVANAIVLPAPTVSSTTPGTPLSSTAVNITNTSDYSAYPGTTFTWSIVGDSGTTQGTSYNHTYGYYPEVVTVEVFASYTGVNSTVTSFQLTAANDVPMNVGNVALDCANGSGEYMRGASGTGTISGAVSPGGHTPVYTVTSTTSIGITPVSFQEGDSVSCSITSDSAPSTFTIVISVTDTEGTTPATATITESITDPTDFNVGLLNLTGNLKGGQSRTVYFAYSGTNPSATGVRVRVNSVSTGSMSNMSTLVAGNGSKSITSPVPHVLGSQCTVGVTLYDNTSGSGAGVNTSFTLDIEPPDVEGYFLPEIPTALSPGSGSYTFGVRTVDTPVKSPKWKIEESSARAILGISDVWRDVGQEYTTNYTNAATSEFYYTIQYTNSDGGLEEASRKLEVDSKTTVFDESNMSFTNKDRTIPSTSSKNIHLEVHSGTQNQSGPEFVIRKMLTDVHEEAGDDPLIYEQIREHVNVYDGHLIYASGGQVRAWYKLELLQQLMPGGWDGNINLSSYPFITIDEEYYGNQLKRVVAEAYENGGNPLTTTGIYGDTRIDEDSIFYSGGVNHFAGTGGLDGYKGDAIAYKPQPISGEQVWSMDYMLGITVLLYGQYNGSVTSHSGGTSQIEVIGTGSYQGHVGGLSVPPAAYPHSNISVGYSYESGSSGAPIMSGKYVGVGGSIKGYTTPK